MVEKPLSTVPKTRDALFCSARFMHNILYPNQPQPNPNQPQQTIDLLCNAAEDIFLMCWGGEKEPGSVFLDRKRKYCKAASCRWSV
jgi:hypothetical protein